jgi:hypothetical protein
MKSQASFQLTRIDEEGTPLKWLGSKATIAVLAHSVLNPNSSGGESLAETRLEVNTVWRSLVQDCKAMTIFHLQ